MDNLEFLKEITIMCTLETLHTCCFSNKDGNNGSQEESGAPSEHHQEIREVLGSSRYFCERLWQAVTSP